ncbi:metal transporter [Desulfococcus sp.]|uniref:metal transporter n=1 Tax=Desulfococcus sp. TaxID=2025834 RepID=UPI0035948041
MKKYLSMIEMMYHQANSAGNCVNGFCRYMNEFMTPYLLAASYFSNAEMNKMATTHPLEGLISYAGLMNFNHDVGSRAIISSMKAMSDFGNMEMKKALDALFDNVFKRTGNGGKYDDIVAFSESQAVMTEMLTHGYPQAIQDIESEFGFGFERGENVKAAETDRFILYQILPIDPQTEVRADGKPILILPPYVLGANILGFLPRENRSYAHCFANLGIPTYIRIMKDIAVTPAVQLVTGEEDARDTRVFCEKIMATHGKPVTLNGYCQGGYMAVCSLLSGELDGVVDALITCVSPMDGTRSRGFKEFFGMLPDRFNELMYGTKTLPNGNKVADGTLMGWVYKLKSIEAEFPLVAFLRDLTMFSPRNGKTPKVSKTAAAINYWLKNERSDLPLSITRMSFASYNTPVTEDGTLPVKLFGRPLNFKRIQEKGIPWLICYGEKDDLVEKETALAPLDFIQAEVAPFPKGHVAIATSWSNPISECALHACFGNENHRGPVRFQLDLDKIISEP